VETLAGENSRAADSTSIKGQQGDQYMSALALLGGTKAKTKPFPVWPYYDQNEERALKEVLESRVWWRTPGTKTLEFEQAFAKFHGARHGIAVTNGTAALEVTMAGLGITAGDEVIVPDFTFVATASAVLFANALPVLVDVDPETYCINPDLVEAAITPRTKAIIAVHMGGHPADLDRLKEIASSKGLALVEDSAHAHASEWRGQRVGTFGVAGTFSFQASKLMTAGEGGMIISNDDKFEVQARSVHDCGRMPGEWFYSHFIYGSNYRLSEWQGAVLKVQLGRLEEQTLHRHRNGRLLDKLFAEIPGITPQKCDPRCTRNGQYAYIFHVDAKQFAGISTENFIAALNAEGIPTQASYPPLHELDCFSSGEYRKCLSGTQATEKHEFLQQRFPNTQRAAWETVWIPQFALLGDEQDMHEIAEAILKIQRHAPAIAASTSKATAERVAR
jgi:dTDP-4-amino-4,6-dideoxygalactose transaminase